MIQDLCGKWMPRKKTTCARGVGHDGDCASAEKMESWRQASRTRVRVDTPDQRRRWQRKSRIVRYGITETRFEQMLGDQGYACAMCRVPFDGVTPNIDHDHDHDHCPVSPGRESRSCGACVRGLLCLKCNTALGYIERFSGLANEYLSAYQSRRAAS